MKIIIPILLVGFYTAAIFAIPSQSAKLGWTIKGQTYLSFQLHYQLFLLGLALVSMLSSYVLNPTSFQSMLSVGNISAVGEELKIFGIQKGDSWLQTGLSLSFFISVGTAVFMYFQLQGKDIDYRLLQTGFLWILLFSLTNSFAEEIIFRVGLNAPLNGLISPNKIFLISAVIFGLAHYKGMPSGLIGVVLAGLLGYVLSKSIQETGGLFWAWWIHFLQDVIIITAVFLIKNSPAS